MAGGELYWRKAEILGKIGFKLDQYNRILSSFKETQGLPAPSMEDVHEYRSYLANHAPVAEAETRFLDNPDDLVCVSEDEPDVIDEDPVPTPIPMQMPMPMQMPIQHPTFPMSEPRSRSPSKPRAVSPYRRQEESSTVTGDDGYDEPPIIPLSVAVTVAVILPILTFLIIPGYPGRLTVVTLVGLSILGALIQGGIVAIRTWELLVCVGLYGAVMAVIAGIV
ncbi:hypothetical protein M426DRAFT_321989 [Hypoxylon sp. CI-4A]|nr:hypothetical protein M426DRAFT_321989 [Hypoxylon sp. CI-4A]